MKSFSLYHFAILAIFAQNEQLAGYYYDRGDFEKLKWDMKKLIFPNMQYFLRVIDCYQQLQQFNSAEKAIQARFEGSVRIGL
jgi:hypothetical protein